MIDSVLSIAVIFAKLPRVDDSIMQSHKIIPAGQASPLTCDHAHKPTPTASASQTLMSRDAR
jgi:hypothetical protein